MINPIFETRQIRLYQGDCLEVMPQLADHSIDFILCDPPFGTTACKWDVVIPFEPLWEQYKRLIKPNGAIALFGSQPFTTDLIMSNRKWFKYEWIWEKSKGGGFLNANRQPLKRHENIIVFAKQLPAYNPVKSKGYAYVRRSYSAGETTQDQSVAGWITINDGERFPVSCLKFHNETGLHPTQKPVKLLEYLIRTYTTEGETVLDNTCGSGSTLVAARDTGRKAIGIEKDPKYCQIAIERCSQLSIFEQAV